MAANTISPMEENTTQCYDDHVTDVNEHIKTLIQLPNMQLSNHLGGFIVS